MVYGAVIQVRAGNLRLAAFDGFASKDEEGEPASAPCGNRAAMKQLNLDDHYVDTW